MASLDWDKATRDRRLGLAKFVDPSKLQMEAKDYALSYHGTFEFMLDMKQRARRSDWWPTRRQAQAIIKCRGHEVRTDPTRPKEPRLT